MNRTVVLLLCTALATSLAGPLAGCGKSTKEKCEAIAKRIDKCSDGDSKKKENKKEKKDDAEGRAAFVAVCKGSKKMQACEKHKKCPKLMGCVFKHYPGMD